MKNVLLTACLCFLISAAHSQIAHDYMIGGGLDLIKTDNHSFFGKAQLGTEFNYFLARPFTATAGFEFWTDDKISFVLGSRWYPIEDFFVRARGLIGENDLSLGAGWSKPLNDNLRFEAIGDFYFAGEFSIRAGVAYLIRKKN
ncbi:MAG: hypothetical protein JNM57_06000 [Cyclobacteriaceae bacterium]|nr:hypothetical protein [Cyclobacteriaceae bacterium]